MASPEENEKILKEFIGNNKVHISFDVDSLDYYSFNNYKIKYLFII